MSTITLAQAKEVIGIGHSARDTVLQIELDGLDDWIERECGIKLSSTSGLSHDCDGGGVLLIPPHRPITAVADVQDLLDTTETQYYELVGDYGIRKKDSAGNYLDDDRWSKGRHRWRVTYTAGYSSVPAGLKAIMLQLIYRAYHNPGAPQVSGGGPAFATWGKLADSDIMRQLQAYKRGRAIH
jgi:hypothetical protein